VDAHEATCGLNINPTNLLDVEFVLLECNNNILKNDDV
jgi:hypothetical protein